MIKVIVFDFDGVIVNSEPSKESAWYDLFRDQTNLIPYLEEGLRKYAHGMGSRFDILRHVFFKSGISKDEVELQVETFSHKYDEAVQRAIHNIGIAADTLYVLPRLATRCPLYINSATPEEALLRTVKVLGIEPHFKGVLGMPKSKVENLEFIQGSEKVGPDETLFVGDGENDARAANAFGCNFIGVSNSWNKWRDKDFPLIRSLSELDVLVENY